LGLSGRGTPGHLPHGRDRNHRSRDVRHPALGQRAGQVLRSQVRRVVWTGRRNPPRSPRGAATRGPAAIGSVSARTAPDRNIAMELVRVTEAAAMAAARWIGRGDKEDADQAAVDAMRFVLDSVAMRGVVVIGEGEKDKAPMLYNGEEVGNGERPEVDVAVDPREGTPPP